MSAGAQHRDNALADAGLGDDGGKASACAGNQQHHACGLQRLACGFFKVLAADVGYADEISAQSSQQHETGDNQTAAAKRLGISRTTLWRLLRSETSQM